MVEVAAASLLAPAVRRTAAVEAAAAVADIVMSKAAGTGSTADLSA